MSIEQPAHVGDSPPDPPLGNLVIDPDMVDIVDGFVVETEETIEKLDHDLVALDSKPGDAELINAVFRSLHTIKGNSKALGFDLLNRLVHKTEDVVRKVRDGEMTVTPAMMDVVLASVDKVKRLLGEINERRKSIDDIGPLIDKLDGVLTGRGVPAEEPLVIEDDLREIVAGFIGETEELLAQLDQDLVALEEKPDNADQVNQVFRAFHTLKGNARALGFTKLEEVDHRTEDVIRLVRDGKAKITAESMDVVLRSVDIIKLLVADIKRGVKSSLSITEIESELALVCSGNYEELRALKAGNAAPSAPVPAARAETRPGAATVRVDIGKLDRLIDVTGELVLNRNRLLNLANQLEEGARTDNIEELLNEINAQMGFLVADIQSGVMSTRMQPIGKVFNKYPRIVRDLSRELGKEIDLTITGSETELDATIVEEIADPLIHMIRNSCDHGIESPEVRAAAGKPTRGTIRLAAYNEGNAVVIEIKDDGKGIDETVIRRKAIEKKLITEAVAAAMTKAEILDLICLPGFSTAQQVTAMSGRGVGMDVVKTGVTKLKGVLELDSEFGKGTSIRIRLPLTLAIIDGLEVEVEGERYLVPRETVVEIISLSSRDYRAVAAEGRFLFREKYLNPLVNLRTTLGRRNGATPPADRGYIVVAGEPERRAGLLVDNVLRQHEVVVKPLGRYLSRFAPDTVSGATIMGDGGIELILNTTRVIERARKKEAEEMAEDSRTTVHPTAAAGRRQP